MARRRAETSEPTKQRSVSHWVVTFGIGLSLLAVFAAGKLTRDTISNSDRYTFAFADVDCTPPPEQPRQSFLAEVQYLAGIPDRLSILDENLATHIADAFAHHPWVEKVERVVIEPATRQVHARLRFRVPILEVRLMASAPAPRPPRSESEPASASNFSEETSWVVDRYGFVLPRIHSGENLPLLLTETRPPGGAGKLWADEMVPAAARTAAYLRSHQSMLKLSRFRAAEGTLVLSTEVGTRVLWGHAPGRELTDEAPAALKLERLLDYCASNKDLDHPAGRYEHDVRPIATALHRPLSPDEPP
jgi:hypothetical protein